MIVKTLAHESLAQALAEQEFDETLVEADAYSTVQGAAIEALLAAFGVSAMDVAGFAQMPGHPLLVIHGVGARETENGCRMRDTEIRALGGGS